MLNRRNLVIFAGILIVIGIVGSILKNYGPFVKPIYEETELDGQQVSSIDVDSHNANVIIQPSSENFIKVTLDGKKTFSIKDSLRTNVKNSTLYITYDEKKRTVLSFPIFRGFKSTTIEVYLPEKQYETILVHNNNGKISAEKLQADEVKFTTNNGKINLNNVHSTKMFAETNNGKINVKDSSANNIDVHADNGKINIDHVDGDIEGDTHNGKIKVSAETLDQNLTLTTHNGKIDVTTKSEPTNVEFITTVHNGKVNILDQYEGNVTIGPGENLIKLTTHNGKISVKNKDE